MMQKVSSGVEGAATALQLRFETAVLEQNKLHTLACKGKIHSINTIALTTQAGQISGGWTMDLKSVL